METRAGPRGRRAATPGKQERRAGARARAGMEEAAGRAEPLARRGALRVERLATAAKAWAESPGRRPVARATRARAAPRVALRVRAGAPAQPAAPAPRVRAAA